MSYFTHQWVTVRVSMRHVTLMNGSCHTYDWFVTHMTHWCVTWHIDMRHDSMMWWHDSLMCHVTHQWVMSHITESWHTSSTCKKTVANCSSLSHIVHWVMSYIKESWSARRWLPAATSWSQMGHDSSVCLACLVVTWLIYELLRHDSFMICYDVTYLHVLLTRLIPICAVTQSCVGHASCICAICRLHMPDMTHLMCVTWLILYVWHDSFICVAWRTPCVWHDSFYICGMTHSCVWHDSFYICDLTRSIWVAWLFPYVWHDSFYTCDWFYMCGMTHSYVWHDSFVCVFTCVTRRILYVWHDFFICLTHSCVCSFVLVNLFYTCGMTQSYVWRDWCICVPWLIHMCGMSLSYVWHDSYICVAWLIHMGGMTHSHVCSHVWIDSFYTYEMFTVGNDSYICVAWLIHMCHMTHSYVWQDAFNCVTRNLHICDITDYMLLFLYRSGSFFLQNWRARSNFDWVMSHTCTRVVSHM